MDHCEFDTRKHRSQPACNAGNNRIKAVQAYQESRQVGQEKMLQETIKM